MHKSRLIAKQKHNTRTSWLNGRSCKSFAFWISLYFGVHTGLLESCCKRCRNPDIWLCGSLIFFLLFQEWMRHKQPESWQGLKASCWDRDRKGRITRWSTRRQASLGWRKCRVRSRGAYKGQCWASKKRSPPTRPHAGLPSLKWVSRVIPLVPSSSKDNISPNRSWSRWSLCRSCLTK